MACLTLVLRCCQALRSQLSLKHGIVAVQSAAIVDSGSAVFSFQLRSELFRTLGWCRSGAQSMAAGAGFKSRSCPELPCTDGRSCALVLVVLSDGCLVTVACSMIVLHGQQYDPVCTWLYLLIVSAATKRLVFGECILSIQSYISLQAG